MEGRESHEIEAEHDKNHVKLGNFLDNSSQEPEKAVMILRALENECIYCEFDLYTAASEAGKPPFDLIRDLVKLVKLETGAGEHIQEKNLQQISTGVLHDMLSETVSIAAHCAGCNECDKKLVPAIQTGETNITEEASKALRDVLERLESEKPAT